MPREYPYYYSWANNERRIAMYCRPCKVIIRGGRNSRLVEFKDGTREVISGFALRKIKETSPLTTPIPKLETDIRSSEFIHS